MIMSSIPQYLVFFALFPTLVSDVGKLSLKLLMMNVWRKVYYLTLNLTLNLPTSDTKMGKSAKNKYCGIELIIIWY